jgi:hypothetical protein
MRDPTRWRDDPTGMTAVSSTLLRGARRPQLPGSRDLERLGAAVEGIARAPIAPPPSFLRLALAGALAFLIVGGGTFVWALHARNAQRLAAATPAAQGGAGAPERAHRTAVAALPAAAPLTAARAPAAPAARPGKRHVAEARVVAPPPTPATEPAAPTDALAREVPLIDAGRADLATAPSRALAALETHRREFPRGQLAAEREFLAVQALVQMNRIADAKTRAQELTAHHPSSSYAARAARLIEDVQAQRAVPPARDGSRTGYRPGSGRDPDRL